MCSLAREGFENQSLSLQSVSPWNEFSLGMFLTCQADSGGGHLCDSHTIKGWLLCPQIATKGTLIPNKFPVAQKPPPVLGSGAKNSPRGVRAEFCPQILADAGDICLPPAFEDTEAKKLKAVAFHQPREARQDRLKLFSRATW